MPKISSIALAALLFMAVPLSAQARSWCASDRLNATERTICAHASLRRLDRELQDIYTEAKAVDEDYGQVAWLKKRNRCYGRASCIASLYRRRIAVLHYRVYGE